jgi:hypothetical protein
VRVELDELLEAGADPVVIAELLLRDA